MSSRAVRVVLTTPWGETIDLSDRIDRGDLGEITEETEEDLLQLTHSDYQTTLLDYDGAMTALFSGMQRGDRWELVVERETRGRRGSWERLFGGLLDVSSPPKSSHTDGTVSLQAFAYSKALETASADGYRRDVSGVTATTTAGSATTTVSSTADLAAGDEICLDDGQSSETQVVLRVKSASSLTTRAAWTHAFSGAALALKTPYYRGRTITRLAADLFALAGIADVQIDVSQELGSVPFLSTLETAGLPDGSPNGVLEMASGKIAVYMGGRSYEATSVRSGFVNAAASTPKVDWRPYLTAAPATLYDASGADDGTRAVDYTTGAYYELEGDDSLILSKNGSAIATVDSKVSTTQDRWDAYGVEVVPDAGEVWVWYGLAWDHPDPLNPDMTLTMYRRVKTLRYTTAGALIGDAPAVGAARWIKSLGYVAIDAARVNGTSRVQTLDRGPISLYRYSGGAWQCVRTFGSGGVKMWTLRGVGPFLCALHRTGPAWRALVLDPRTGKTVADYSLGSGTMKPRAAVYGPTGTIPAYLGTAGYGWFLLGTEFSQIVPYADFDGCSVAEALKQLALICGAHLWVDEYGVGHLVGRRSASVASREPVELPEAIESDELPIWEWLRRSIEVTGKDEAGEDISEIAGDRGDSALRLSVDVQIPLTQGFAAAIASGYDATLDVVRRQRDDVYQMDDRRVRLLDPVVREDGSRWHALRVTSSLTDEEQTVQLVEDVDQ